MNKGLLYFLGVIIVIAILVGNGAVYTVQETEQVVVTRFGEPIGQTITKAGLHFKMPVADTANRFDNRLLQWDGDPNQIQTSEKRFIWVDTTARWQIVDALKFMKSVRIESNAQSRLDDIIDGATRNVIAKYKLAEAVRDTNRLLEEKGTSTDEYADFSTASLEEIKVGREQLSREILTNAAPKLIRFGIKLVDVRIKRINYIREVQQQVFDRMISERLAVAAKYRAEGQGTRAEIEGRMAKELQTINSAAYRKAQEIKGKADAEAIHIYADAYNRDPAFYSFVKTLDSYRKTINKSTTFILSTENEFYEHLNGTSVDRP